MYNLSLSDKILSVLGRDDLVNQIPKTIVLTLFRIKYGTLVNYITSTYCVADTFLFFFFLTEMMIWSGI